MATTTEYGTWCNQVDRHSVSVEQTVMDAFGSEGPDGFNFDAIVSDYRAAINDALPNGVTLSGDQFIGPYYPKDQHFDGYPLDDEGALDLKAIVDGVNLGAIIQRHADPAVDNDSVIKLYEDNADSLYLQADDGPVWNMGTEPLDRGGKFSRDAATWIAGDWKPNEDGGHVRTNDAGLRLLATWTTAGGLQWIVRPDGSIGGTAFAYLAEQ